MIRTAVFLRFRSEVSDSARLVFLGRRGIRPAGLTPAGSYWVEVPDPGTDFGGFGRMMESLAKSPEVQAVYPISAATRTPIGAPSKVRASVHDSAGRPVRGVVVCPGPPRGGPARPTYCAATDSAGSAVVSLPGVGDTQFQAECRPFGEVTALILSSLDRAVGPDVTGDLRFTVPALRCDPRAFVDAFGTYQGFLAVSTDSVVFFSTKAAWVGRPEGGLIWRGWPERRLRPGCFALSARGLYAGPAAYGPAKRFEYQLTIESVEQVRRMKASACRPGPVLEE